jgi:hypothetical protein
LKTPLIHIFFDFLIFSAKYLAGAWRHREKQVLTFESAGGSLARGPPTKKEKREQLKALMSQYRERRASMASVSEDDYSSPTSGQSGPLGPVRYVLIAI